MSLEVDHRVGVSRCEQPQKEAYRYSDEKEIHRSACSAINGVSSLCASASIAETTPKRSTTWLLAIALGVVTVLAIVAAAVGGSTAVKRKNE